MKTTKQILMGNFLRLEFLKGINNLADVVKVTLGPKGRNVIIEKDYGNPLITNDGVTIAKEIKFENKYQNMAAQLVIEAANKTNEIAGDGTTTATILTQSILNRSLKAIDRGCNPILVKKGIEYACGKIVDELEKCARPIKTDTDIKNIAAISSGDEKIGLEISKAIEKVGKDGIISVDEGNDFETKVEVVEGLQYDSGYLSPYFVNDKNSMSTTLTNPLILVTDQKISNIKEILPILEIVSKEGRALLIIAEDVDNEVLSTLILNKISGALTNLCLTKAPGFGDSQKETLQDICCAVGAKFISNDLKIKISETTEDDLGTAKKIVIKKDNTTIYEGNGKKDEINKRISFIKSQIAQTSSEYEKGNLQKRLSKLSGGIALIKVGAMTESELKEKKLRIEDATNATKAAIKEGIIPGGGYTFVQIYKKLKNKLKLDTNDENKGIDAVIDSLVEPIKLIADNAGHNGDEILDKQLSETKPNCGFNAKDGQWCDLLKNGVVDPKLVARTSIQNASSIAGILITAEVGISLQDAKHSCGCDHGDERNNQMGM